MRRKLVVGNWKMNLTRGESIELARAIVAGVAQAAGNAAVDVGVCPPFVYLEPVAAVLAQSSVALGAQNMYDQEVGAFTGEIGAPMLVDLGCRYVILGHSERRHLMGESDQQVHAKLRLALTHSLAPIVCLGETLEQRQAGDTRRVVGRQFDQSLGGLADDEARQVVIAYEPVWAIGTGQVATPQQAEEVHADLRRMLETRYNVEVSNSVRILYGGSVKPDNAGQLMNQANIDGALVGGAALMAETFLAIVRGTSSNL